MKLKTEEIAGSGQKRYVFALNKEEAELILGCVIASWKFFPRVDRWKQDGRRMENIIKALKSILWPK